MTFKGMEYRCLTLLSMVQQKPTWFLQELLSTVLGFTKHWDTWSSVSAHSQRCYLAAYRKHRAVWPPPQAVWDSQPRCVRASDPQRIREGYSGSLHDSRNCAAWLWHIKELLPSRPQRLYLLTGALSGGPHMHWSWWLLVKGKSRGSLRNLQGASLISAV